MTDILPIVALGRRIVIMGPTNAGKSTLAVALAEKLGLPALHVDLFRHLPGTNWVQRPTVEFHALHDEAIAADEWVIDGNYSEVLPQRLARATGIIVLDDALWRRYWRYLLRTLGLRPRAGNLEGNKDSIKWEMLHWLWHTRNGGAASRVKAEATGLPTLFCHNRRELDALCTAWGLNPFSASPAPAGFHSPQR